MSEPGVRKVPRRGYCFRCTADGIGEGVLMRVVLSDPHGVTAVQEALIPRLSWSGTIAEFWRDFVFIVGPAPSYHRGTNTTW